jgi:aspartyl-tRNA(Asn)/glutamyl-tRNA(Gln) amidotransferase subunit A
MTGIIPYAVTLDTLGIHTRSVEHAAKLYDVLARPGLPRAGDCVAIGPPRVGIWADALAHSEELMRAGVVDAIEHLVSCGAIVSDAVAPFSFDNLIAMHSIISRAEGAAAHSQLIAQYSEEYSPKVRAMVETGMALPADVYVRAQRLRDQARSETVEAWSRFDVIAIPTSDVAAPDRATTGNHALQAVATMLGLPSLTLPIGFNPEYLPLGMQLIGTHPEADAHLLRVARWVETHMPRLPRPPHGVQRVKTA